MKSGNTRNPLLKFDNYRFKFDDQNVTITITEHPKRGSFRGMPKALTLVEKKKKKKEKKKNFSVSRERETEEEDKEQKGKGLGGSRERECGVRLGHVYSPESSIVVVILGW